MNPKLAANFMIASCKFFCVGRRVGLSQSQPAVFLNRQIYGYKKRAFVTQV